VCVLVKIAALPCVGESCGFACFTTLNTKLSLVASCPGHVAARIRDPAHLSKKPFDSPLLYSALPPSSHPNAPDRMQSDRSKNLHASANTKRVSSLQKGKRKGHARARLRWLSSGWGSAAPLPRKQARHAFAAHPTASAAPMQNTPSKLNTPSSTVAVTPIGSLPVLLGR